MDAETVKKINRKEAFTLDRKSILLRLIVFYIADQRCFRGEFMMRYFAVLVTLCLSLFAKADSGGERAMELLIEAKAPAICSINFCTLQVEDVTCSVGLDPETAYCEMKSTFTAEKIQLKSLAAAEFMDYISTKGSAPSCDSERCEMSVKKVKKVDCSILDRFDKACLVTP